MERASRSVIAVTLALVLLFTLFCLGCLWCLLRTASYNPPPPPGDDEIETTLFSFGGKR